MENISTEWASGTLMLNSPFTSVAHPSWVDAIMTETPASGSPVESITFPDTVSWVFSDLADVIGLITMIFFSIL